MRTGVISARLVEHPRRSWVCDSCGAYIGRDSYVRMYGSSGNGEAPYRIAICRACADRCAGVEPKVRAALAAPPEEKP